jgi:hypothetical protein
MRRAIALAPAHQEYRVQLAQIEARIAARQKPPRDDRP